MPETETKLKENWSDLCFSYSDAQRENGDFWRIPPGESNHFRKNRDL